jgi:fatty acid desaturase
MTSPPMNPQTPVAVLPEDSADPGPGEERGSFLELSKRVKAAGLLELAPRYYAGRMALNLLLVAAGVTAFALIGDSWYQLLVAVYLALCFAQCGFMWHDAGHKAMFRSRRAATIVGRIHANLINGVSFGWWVNHHNKHHSHPNHLDLDPDIARRTAIFHVRQYESRRGLKRFVARHQGVLFFVLLVFEFYKIQKTSVLAVLRRDVRHPWAEGSLLAARMAIYLTAVFWVLSPPVAICFIAVSYSVEGMYLGLLFAPNHKGMALREGEGELDWLERQVLTSRNIRPSRVTDFMYGGLNYQIEHHLFPAMPQKHLARCREIVRGYCAELNIPYREVGFFTSYREVASFLHTVSAPLRDGSSPAAGQLAA